MVKITPTQKNGLKKDSAADCFQIRSVSLERFLSHIGSVETDIIMQAQEAVNRVIAVSKP
jgi:mRNA interferase MazF